MKRLGVLSGLRYPLWGLRFVFWEQRSLARFWVWPILLTAVVATSAVYFAITRHDLLLDLILSPPDSDSHFAIRGLYLVGEVLFTTVLAAVALVVSLLLGNVFAAPFNDALSEEVERLLTGRSGPSLSVAAMMRDVVRSIRVELSKLALYAAVMLPLFVVSLLVPVAGPVLYAAFGFVFTAMYFAVDYVDWPATRRGLGARERARLARSRLGTFFGFGVGVWLFLWVPVVNLLLMPAAVAGGTRLFLDLEASGNT